MSKSLGLTKQHARLPPRRGQVKIRIFHLIIELLKERVIGILDDNENVLKEKFSSRGYNDIS